VDYRASHPEETRVPGGGTREKPKVKGDQKEKPANIGRRRYTPPTRGLGKKPCDRGKGTRKKGKGKRTILGSSGNEPLWQKQTRTYPIVRNNK